MSGKGRGKNYEAKKMAWELREARLEEELDEAQQQNSELRGSWGVWRRSSSRPEKAWRTIGRKRWRPA